MKRFYWLLILFTIPGIVNGEINKWQYLSHVGKKDYVISVRDATDTSFEPLISCHADETHCRFLIDADEMRAVLERVITNEIPAETWKDSKKAEWQPPDFIGLSKGARVTNKEACGQDDCGADPK